MPSAVRVDGVSHWFRPKGEPLQALSEVDLDVAPGEFVSLIGPSGCGKSTLLRLIGGLLPVDRGRITVDGETPDEARRRKHYALVPQTPALLPWRTVRDNVALLGQVNRRAGAVGLSADEQVALLGRIGLGSFLDALPGELSGGMQQRVSIARAFALGAPVLLLDEPFSALDELSRAEMRYQLLDLWSRSDCTALFVTHSIPEAVVLSDRVVVFGPRPGHVVRVVDIPLARPREERVEDTPAFHDLVAEVRAALHEGDRGVA